MQDRAPGSVAWRRPTRTVLFKKIYTNLHVGRIYKKLEVVTEDFQEKLAIIKKNAYFLCQFSSSMHALHADVKKRLLELLNSQECTDEINK